jgi:periplasmic copper chaperone A
MYRLFALAFAAVAAAFPFAVFAEGTQSPITVEQPYARATPAGALTGAVYMTLNNTAPVADRLTSVSSDVAGKVQLHEMTLVNGVMQMRQLADGLPVPAGGSVVLKPGGYHVMLIGLKEQLKAGETFALTLTFEKAGNISIAVPVQAMGAAATGAAAMGAAAMGAAKDKTGDGMSGMGTGGGMSSGGGMSNMEMK